MDINTLIEEGKVRIAKRKVESEQESQARARAKEEQAALELAKFKCEALGEFQGIQGVRVDDLPEIGESTFQVSVHLMAPLCEPVRAIFNLERPYSSAPRGNCTWKLNGFYVARVALDMIGGGVDEPWGVISDMRDCLTTMFLDEAMVLASAQCVERIILGNEALHMNEANKAEIAVQAERAMAQRDMQRAVFHPFTWYRVYYAIVAIDDEVGKMADQDSFECLRDVPGADGYFATVHGKSVKPAMITRIERMTCDSVDALPRWCQTFETEWGTIRVPPPLEG